MTGSHASDRARREPFGRLDGVRAQLQDIAQRGGKLPQEHRALLSEALEALSTTVEELKVAEEELRQQNAELSAAYEELLVARTRYRDLFEFAPGAYVVTDRHAVIRQANRAFLELIGRPPDQIVGQPLIVYIGRDDRTTFHRHVNHLLDAEDRARREWESRVATTDADGEMRNVPVFVTAATVTDRGGEKAGLRWLIRDISEQKAAQEALVAAERQALVGRLTFSLAHEIGNPLQSVMGCLNLIQDTVGDEQPRVRELLEIGQEELRRTGAIVDRLRDVTRSADPQNRETTDVNGLLDRVLTLTEQHVADHHVRLMWRPSDELPEVSAVPGRLHQVFLNLILNAVEAMPEGGELDVRTERRDSRVCAMVRDTGVGIPPHRRERLFQPFYTTKETGMGLGLYITRQIVKEHEGEIAVVSEEGVGTTFTVCLPIGD
jgi:PAS domain S-box-containing protein